MGAPPRVTRRGGRVTRHAGRRSGSRTARPGGTRASGPRVGADRRPRRADQRPVAARASSDARACSSAPPRRSYGRRSSSAGSSLPMRSPCWMARSYRSTGSVGASRIAVAGSAAAASGRPFASATTCRRGATRRHRGGVSARRCRGRTETSARSTLCGAWGRCPVSVGDRAACARRPGGPRGRRRRCPASLSGRRETAGGVCQRGLRRLSCALSPPPGALVGDSAERS